MTRTALVLLAVLAAAGIFLAGRTETGRFILTLFVIGGGGS